MRPTRARPAALAVSRGGDRRPDTCVADAGGISRTSSVGTINGTAIGQASGSINIPLVAQVFFNETTTGPGGQLVRNAVRVQTPLGQQIILGSCRLG
jgi:hypothetical protein